jgi:LuxR family maltose regulon positive regulatory protein
LEQLLTTKLFIPHTRPELVSRPRLIERLNACTYPSCKLTLISTPAGFGKTTLVSEWVQTVGGATPPIAIAWLSLDEGDNDRARFLTYLIAALNQTQETGTTIGKVALSMLHSPKPPPVEAVLTPLINEIANISGRIILVLDDYHVIESSQVDEALAFLLENLPPQLHLVIATREDPRLPLSRLRARGQLTELRAADLRFTLAEVAKFLNQVMDLDLSTENIAALERRTEGWIAGLQLAAISLLGKEDTTQLIKSFSGSHRLVLDYLIDEVLNQQPESVQNFLLQTAILDRLTGSLCDALTGQDNGGTTLEMLERANLFIVPLDEERRWFRYHHLFIDLLSQRLRQNKPDQIPGLHERASAWYAQNGFVDEAIEHSMRALDFERAAHLIEEFIDVLWGRGEHRKLQGWLEGLPDEMLFSKPYLSIYLARYRCNSGQLDGAEQILNAVEEVLTSSTDTPSETDPSDREKLRGRAAATRALICSYQGDVQGIIQHARNALEYLPEHDLTWRCITAEVLGNALGFKGDMAAAYEARYKALQACEAAGDIFLVMLGNLQLVITLREQGQLQRTIEKCQQQFQSATEFGISQTRLSGYLLSVWGETLAELNDLNGALDRGKKGFKLTERSGDLQMIGWSFMCLIRILFSRGDLTDAEAIIHKMESRARKSLLPPWIANQMSAWQARIWLAQDKVDDASQWALQRGLYTGEQIQTLNEIGFFLLFDYVVLARILIAQGHLDESVGMLEHLLKAAESGGRNSKVIEIRILQALAFQAKGETDRALFTLEKALTLAEPEGFIRIFVDEGPPMARLLYEALAREIAPDYIRRLLAAFSDAETEQSDATESQVLEANLVEPLSDREIEVLHLIAEGLTNQEIAARLYLSLNTVKVHTRNIYGKLDAHNRTQAVTRARVLGILPTP